MALLHRSGAWIEVGVDVAGDQARRACSPGVLVGVLAACPAAGSGRGRGRRATGSCAHHPRAAALDVRDEVISRVRVRDDEVDLAQRHDVREPDVAERGVPGQHDGAGGGADEGAL